MDARAEHVADTQTSAESHEPTGTRPFAAFEWMLSLRYLRARRKEGFISVIAGFSFLGILLGVAQAIGGEIDPGWQTLAGHLAFLLVLAVRPAGLFPKVRG